MVRSKAREMGPGRANKRGSALLTGRTTGSVQEQAWESSREEGRVVGKYGASKVSKTRAPSSHDPESVSTPASESGFIEWKKQSMGGQIRAGQSVRAPAQIRRTIVDPHDGKIGIQYTTLKPDRGSKTAIMTLPD
ncbi:hypothetical protein O988_07097 [Pseudogymnoascus sp. VKM F-3808]|nr:hypothetical protein O988_07097 [Pseudogymnoascus sp. VKM F-3808]